MTNKYSLVDPSKVAAGTTWLYGGVVQTGSLTAGPTATDIAAAVWAASGRSLTDKAGFALSSSGLDVVQVEPSINARQALSAILADAAGTITGDGAARGTGQALVKSPAGVVRMTATMTADQRTAVTISLPA